MPEVMGGAPIKERVAPIEAIAQHLGSPAEYATLWQVLLSLRRVTAVMRTGRGIVNSSTYANPSAEFGLIQHELESLHGLHLSEDHIRSAMRQLTQIEWDFDILCKRSTRRARWIDPRADYGETYECAKKATERAIWDTWSPPSDVKDAPESLARVVRGHLHYLPELVRRSSFHGMNRGVMYSLDALGEEKDGDTRATRWDEKYYPHSHVEAVYERTPRKSAQHAMKIWYEAVRDMSIQEIFQRIALLEPMHQLVLLDRFKYINPSIPFEKRIAGYGMSRQLYGDRTIQAVRAFTNQDADAHTLNKKLPHNIERVSISDVLTSALSARVLYMNGRVLHYDSPRIKLLSAHDAGTIGRIMSGLDTDKRKIIELAIELAPDGRSFVNNNEQIAKVLDTYEGKVEDVLGEALHILRSGERRFVRKPSQGGASIYPESPHAHLIKRAQAGDLTPLQRASLTPQMLKIYERMTTPDPSGAYPRWSDVMQDGIGTDTKLMPKLVRALADTQWITEIQMQVAQGLTQRQDFTPNEWSMLNAIAVRLKTGVPSRSRTNGGLALLEIALSFGISRSEAERFRQKLAAIKVEEQKDSP